MLAVVQKTPAVGYYIANGGHEQQLIQVPCRRQRPAAAVSSLDGQWVLVQQVLRGCRPWGHIQAVRLGTRMWEAVRSADQGTTASR
jgi:hypothetical protein